MIKGAEIDFVVKNSLKALELYKEMLILYYSLINQKSLEINREIFGFSSNKL